MMFKAPSPLVYLSSLLLAVLLASLAYWIIRSQGLDTNTLLVLTVGLVIGHFIGVCTVPSQAGKRKASIPADERRQTRTSTVPSGETVSLYVGNLAYNAQRNALHELFAQYGQVSSVRIMTDRATRRPRGYAFVEMDSNAAQQAIAQLDNTEFCGRTLRVSEAKQRNRE
jgi:hypothetical protein